MKFVAQKDLTDVKAALDQKVVQVAEEKARGLVKEVGLGLDPVELMFVMIEAHDAIKRKEPTSEQYPVLAQYLCEEQPTIREVAQKFIDAKTIYLGGLAEVKERTQRLKDRISETVSRQDLNDIFISVEAAPHMEDIKKDFL